MAYRRIGAIACLLDVLLVLLLGTLSGGACHAIWTHACGGPGFFSLATLPCALGYVAAMQVQGLYRPAAILHGRASSDAAAGAWVVAAAGLLAVAFVAGVSSEISRGAFLVLFCGGLLLLPPARREERRLLNGLINRNGLAMRCRVALFGDLAAIEASDLAAKLGRYGYGVAGQFGTRSSEGDEPDSGDRQLAALSALRAFIRAERVDQILLVFEVADQRSITLTLAALRSTPLPVKMLLAERHDELPDGLAALRIEDLGPVRAATLQNGPLSEWQQLAKRCFDCLAASCALLLLAPLLVAVMAAIKIESPGPALFRQRRSGFNGRVFRIYKLRSMRTLDDGAHIVQATRNDARVTRVGRLIRRTSIDELPQLINVLRGEMSIVGPRPHAVSHDDEYSKAIASYALRHHMKPGITGWAQANGYRGQTSSLHLMEARVQHDLWYIANWSMMLDLKAVMLTAVEVFKASDGAPTAPKGSIKLRLDPFTRE